MRALEFATSTGLLFSGSWDGTVCAWDGEGGIRAMSETMPSATVHEFPSAGHSIHNSEDRKAVLEIVKGAVDEVAAAAAKLGGASGEVVVKSQVRPRTPTTRAAFKNTTPRARARPLSPPSRPVVPRRI